MAGDGRVFVREKTARGHTYLCLVVPSASIDAIRASNAAPARPLPSTTRALASIATQRNRWFADSSLERVGFEPVVPPLFFMVIRLKGLTRLLRGAQQRLHRAQGQNSSLPTRGWSNQIRTAGPILVFRDRGGRLENKASVVAKPDKSGSCGR